MWAQPKREVLAWDARRPLSPQTGPLSVAPYAIDRVLPDQGTSGSAPGLVICPVRHAGDLEEVYRLTHDTYVTQGYCLPRHDGRLVHYPRLEGIPQTTVLVALLQNTVMGTVSITLDGPRGLHADEDFRTACDAIREEGRALAACWRIVTREQYRGERHLVLALIRETAQLVVQKEVETILFTTHPRHEGIYKKLFHMETVARHDGTIGSLRNAPAVLLRLNCADNPDWRIP